MIHQIPNPHTCKMMYDTRLLESNIKRIRKGNRKSNMKKKQYEK